MAKECSGTFDAPVEIQKAGIFCLSGLVKNLSNCSSMDLKAYRRRVTRTYIVEYYFYHGELDLSRINRVRGEEVPQ